MVQTFLGMNLGEWGVAIIKWIAANSLLVALILLVWMILVVTGKTQLTRIKLRTHALVLERARQVLPEDPRVSAAEFYDRLYPEWCQMVSRSAWFIPHRWELWPQPATPTAVRDRIGFTPDWVQRLLAANGFHLGRHS